MRTASTSIGDGGVANEDIDPATDGVRYPTTEEIDVDNAKEPKILPYLELQIKDALAELPNLRTNANAPNTIYKQNGDQLTPEAYKSKYPPGMSLIRNAATINTSPDVRPSTVQHTLRGVDVYILHPPARSQSVRRHGD